MRNVEKKMLQTKYSHMDKLDILYYVSGDTSSKNIWTAIFFCTDNSLLIKHRKQFL